MTNQSDLELIQRYAPIVWLHQDEAFLPENCRVMEQYARLGTRAENLRIFQLDELGNLPNSDKYYMDIPELDYAGFGTRSSYQGVEVGPEGVGAHARSLLGNNPFSVRSARAAHLCYHARVVHLTVEHRPDEPFSRFFEDHDPGVFGAYTVIQYFFYYIFNDAWNKHIGDWDSTLELFIGEDNSRGYAILHMHHTTWMMRFGGRPLKLKSWIGQWQKSEARQDGKHKTYPELNPLFHFAQHPFIFIARGAHGGYPTPGFSIHGIKALKTRVIGQTDYRQIGGICIYPPTAPVSPDALLDILKEGEVDTSGTKFLSWEEPVHLQNQSWLKYKGLWGSKSEYSGWAGPTGPNCKKYWRMDQRFFKSALDCASEGDYRGNWVLKIFRNWHGWRKTA